MQKKSTILVCLLLIASMLLVSAVVVAPKPPPKPPGGDSIGTEYQLTNMPGREEIPMIYGKTIVWSDNRNGNYDIYAYYLGPDGIPFTGDANEGEYAISSNPENEDWPSIDGNKIVYRRFVEPGRGDDIVLYHLGEDGIPGTNDNKEGEYLITNSAEMEYRPDVYENLVVWGTMYQYNDLGITLYDLGENEIPDESDSQMVIPDSVGGSVPKIDGNNVIFWINTDIGIYHIFGPGQGQTDIHVTPYRSYDWFWGTPQISGNIIVWPDDRNSKNPNRPDVPQWINWDIYMYDLGDDGIYGTSDDGGESPLVNTNNDEWDPAIHEDKVVFITGSNTNVGVYDLATGKMEKITSSGSTSGPDIYGNHIVYEVDISSDFREDIYLFVLNP